ncbi:MAG: carbohydrate porin [Acetobacteraceae bacterium]
MPDRRTPAGLPAANRRQPWSRSADLMAVVVLSGALAMAAPSARAQAAPIDPETQNIWQRERLTGDWGGLRSALENHGISLGLTNTADVLGNVTGGVKRGAVFEGLATPVLEVDLDKLAGWTGGRFKVSSYGIYGRGLTANNVRNLLTISNIEVVRSLRLGDLYLEQDLFQGGLNVRVGQIAADTEFVTSDFAGVFINSTFGWPGLHGNDLPGGGPAYPYSTPGVRVRYTASDAFSVQAGIYNGNPLGANGDWGGTEFPIDGWFGIIEAAYSTKPGAGGGGLGGTYKLGAWYNSLRFSDVHVDTAGLSLANPASTGTPASHTGNFGIYAVVDHMLWRKPGTEGGGLGGFIRVTTAPQQNRNPVYVYVDAGLTFQGPLRDRDDDIVGIGFGWANLSHGLRSLDRDTIFFTGVNQPIRSSEIVVELTYQAQVTPWLVLQPDFQYVIRPSGGISDPNDPTKRIGNAAVFGLRSIITF